MQPWARAVSRLAEASSIAHAIERALVVQPRKGVSGSLRRQSAAYLQRTLPTPKAVPTAPHLTLARAAVSTLATASREAFCAGSLVSEPAAYSSVIVASIFIPAVPSTITWCKRAITTVCADVASFPSNR